MVYHLRIQYSEIDNLPVNRLEEAIAAVRQIREDLKKQQNG